ncbi:hypothetical protein [Streptomyces sp. S1]
MRHLTKVVFAVGVGYAVGRLAVTRWGPAVLAWVEALKLDEAWDVFNEE